ncbi:MAG TPA: hypothetical protein VED63_06200, partial [Acidimicrobiales bacterium]|nr:hypothetical protein [Acidimicrobiales bacterium]
MLHPLGLWTAFCQFCTFLTMAEYVATDVLAPWLPKFNTYVHEIKLFSQSRRSARGGQTPSSVEGPSTQSRASGPAVRGKAHAGGPVVSRITARWP